MSLRLAAQYHCVPVNSDVRSHLEALGLLYALQMVVLIVAVVIATAGATFASRKAARGATLVALLACFILSFAVAGFHLTFVQMDVLPVLGPLSVALVSALALWRMRANASGEQSET